MGMFFLTPEQQAAKEAEEAELEAMREAIRNGNGVKRNPISQWEATQINMAERYVRLKKKPE